MRLAVGCATFGDVPMNRIQRAHVERWVKQMQTLDRGEKRPLGLAPGTIRTRIMNVRSVLNWAVRDRLIPADPSQGVRLPARRTEAAMSLPTPFQVDQLMLKAPPAFKAFVALCAFAGLRLGETAALKAGDLDAVAKTLKVARQVQRERGSGVDVTPQLRLRADCLPVGRTTCRTNSSHCSLCTWTRTQRGFARWMVPPRRERQSTASKQPGLLVAKDTRSHRLSDATPS
jgi:hypothetical protein